ncbi:MAG: hypothetical protein CVU23_05260 [Betaproteobacteria bacterium HGW-Betaproteobacteria-17]|nr:MAG: hypothetical protein CVU23_05260 [Betaproteobacteria bacterium HGW-Betaproteobacteria-17]
MCGRRLRDRGILKILAADCLTKMVNNSFKISSRGENMKNPLDSLWGTVIAGVVLTVVLFVFARNFLG